MVQTAPNTKPPPIVATIGGSTWLVPELRIPGGFWPVMDRPAAHRKSLLEGTEPFSTALSGSATDALKIRVSGVQFPPWPFGAYQSATPMLSAMRFGFGGHLEKGANA
jgi:hypothetical protein